MWHLTEQQLMAALRGNPDVKAALADLTEQVRTGQLQPSRAAAQLVAAASSPKNPEASESCD